MLFACTGSLLGACYPAVAHVLLSRHSGAPDAARAGGLVDALDHLGATLGALTVGTVVLPAAGASTTLRLIALAAAAVGGIWLARTDT